MNAKTILLYGSLFVQLVKSGRVLKVNMLKFNTDTIEAVRTSYDLHQPGRMEDAVNILSEWANKQKHFVKKDFSPQYLERMIIAAKGSLEKAKQRIDKLCTVKTLIPQFFNDVDAETYFQHLSGKISHVILPKMTPEHDRVIVAKYVGKEYNSSMILDGFRSCVMLAEYLKVHDYANSYHVVIDFRKASLPSFVTSLNIMDVRQVAVILTEGYGMRVKAIHLITDSKVVETLIGIAKQVLSDKISKRISVHKDLKTLHQIIPKQCLPEELGGIDKTVDELSQDWMKEISTDEYRNYWREAIKAGTDESERGEAKFSEKYMGLPGSFRKLIMD